MTQLCDLAVKYDSDKGPQGHSYSVIYDALFQNRNIRKALEIGLNINVASGSGYSAPSLRMWADYWPQAEIWGLDKDEVKLVNEGRIHSALCDQSKKDSLEAVVPIIGSKFDLIIDDGSHEPQDQILTAQILMPLLNTGGLYIIEDMTRDYLPTVMNALISMFPNFAFRRIPSLAFISGRYGHSQLIVIEA